MSVQPTASEPARRPPRPRPGWLQLPKAERRATLATAVLVPIFHVLVRVIVYRRTMAAAEWTATRWPFRRPSSQPTETIECLRLATARVQRYSPLPGNCLSRSLASWWSLRRRGLAPDLRLGVSLAGGDFAAHAWVELEGRVLNDTATGSERYRPLAWGTGLLPRR
jgi:hypothetical protein